MKKKIFVFVDVETTGLLRPVGSEHQPYITEIAVVKTNHKMKEIDRFTTLVNIPVPVPYFITRITGITDEMLFDAPRFCDIIKDLKKIMRNVDVFVGHNAMFDYRLIVEQLKRENKKNFLPNEVECTVEKSIHIMGYRLKLDGLYELATKQNSIKGHHRALNDVMATIDCFKWLTKKR